MTDSAKTSSEETSVADAFRSPSPEGASKPTDGIRLKIHPDLPIVARKIQPRGWSAFWRYVFPDATVVEISRRFNVTLKIYPTNVHIGERRWISPLSVIPRYHVTIPVYDEFGDSVVHKIHIKSQLAFLYPFVPMHIKVTVDDVEVFGQGKHEFEITLPSGGSAKPGRERDLKLSIGKRREARPPQTLVPRI